jgi:hypothetical protein
MKARDLIKLIVHLSFQKLQTRIRKYLLPSDAGHLHKVSRRTSNNSINCKTLTLLLLQSAGGHWVRAHRDRSSAESWSSLGGEASADTTSEMPHGESEMNPLVHSFRASSKVNIKILMTRCVVAHSQSFRTWNY